MSPSSNLTVEVNARLRHRWMFWLAMWLVRRATVQIEADGKPLGKAGRFTLQWEDESEDVAP